MWQHDAIPPRCAYPNFTRLIEFGMVVDTTKLNSIITETWRNYCLRLIFRESAPSRFFFGTPDLSVLAGSGHCSWPASKLLAMAIEVTVLRRGGCRND
jgi:hypothetical protein